VAAVGLLVVGIAAMFLRPFGLPLWAGPVAAAAAGLATQVVHWGDASDSLTLLTKPLLFLLFAVPLAIALDRIGVFESLAAMVDGGQHLVGGLWFLAAAVTIVFNLDASVVLLTPLYIRIAQRHGYSPEMLAFQPALLACIASNPLPVSNLTNLIVAASSGATPRRDWESTYLGGGTAPSVSGWAFPHWLQRRRSSSSSRTFRLFETERRVCA
jgi:arsenical pump membrane protein